MIIDIDKGVYTVKVDGHTHTINVPRLLYVYDDKDTNLKLLQDIRKPLKKKIEEVFGKETLVKNLRFDRTFQVLVFLYTIVLVSDMMYVFDERVASLERSHLLGLFKIVFRADTKLTKTLQNDYENYFNEKMKKDTVEHFLNNAFPMHESHFMEWVIQFNLTKKYPYIRDILRYKYTHPRIELEEVAKRQNRYYVALKTIPDHIKDYFNLEEVFDTLLEAEMKHNIAPRYDTRNLIGEYSRILTLVEEKKNSAYSKLIERRYRKEYEWENEDYILLQPKNALDFMIEARQQDNCLEQYIETFADEETRVFFLRDKRVINDSLLTIEYEDGHIQQAVGYQNDEFIGEDLEKIIDDIELFLRKVDGYDE